MSSHFTMLGGDRRSVSLAQLLVQDGHEVTVFAMEHASIPDVQVANSLEEALRASNLILAPLPFSNDVDEINTPLSDQKISISHVLEQLGKEDYLLAGHVDRFWMKEAEARQVNLLDYFRQEELQVCNALPTAEGCLQIAMENRDTTIHGSHVFVLGFGRIGRMVAKLFHALGAHVYVAARSYSQLAWIKLHHYEAVIFDEMKDRVHQADILVNTVPARIVDQSLLQAFDPNCLLIDLASKPGGIDAMAAKSLGLQHIWALGLPGKVAPLTAASCIKDTIYHLIKDPEGKV